MIGGSKVEVSIIGSMRGGVKSKREGSMRESENSKRGFGKGKEKFEGSYKRLRL
jgi:hypothetical protein